jgi:tripartite-type tricarboxylate transporter receptor subunit TctC
MAIVARASPDGYTMGLGSVGHLTFSPIVRPGLPYDTQKDLAPVTLAAVQPFLMAISPSLPANSVKEFIALAKSRPGSIKYGSGGVGAASHVGVALLEMQTGAKLLHVSYKGSNPALTAVMAGEIEMALAGLATILPHARAGKVRALAVTGSRRAQIAPDIPTVAESGAPGYAFDVWYGLVLTGGTPQPIVAKANAEARKRLATPEVQKRFLAVGIESMTTSVGEFTARIASETANWRKVVKAADIKVQ